MWPSVGTGSGSPQSAGCWSKPRCVGHFFTASSCSGEMAVTPEQRPTALPRTWRRRSSRRHRAATMEAQLVSYFETLRPRAPRGSLRLLISFLTRDDDPFDVALMGIGDRRVPVVFNAARTIFNSSSYPGGAVPGL